MHYGFNTQDLATVARQCQPTPNHRVSEDLTDAVWVEGALVNGHGWAYWNSGAAFHLHYRNTGGRWVWLRLEQVVNEEDEHPWEPAVGTWPDPWDFEINVLTALRILVSNMTQQHDMATSRSRPPSPPSVIFDEDGPIIELVVDETGHATERTYTDEERAAAEAPLPDDLPF